MNYREKNTKIVATISDLRCNVEFIQELYDHGLDVVRLNTAHQDFDGTKKVIDNVRKVSDKIGLLLDTKGPEVRTSNLVSDVVVAKGDEVLFSGDASVDSERVVFVNYSNFHLDVPVGAEILVNDGELSFNVLRKSDNALICVANNSGVVKNKKTVNVPSVHLNLCSVSDKDKEFVNFAIDNDLDFIAHSFVRSKEDVLAVQKLLDARNSDIKIIAKIENREGVDNIDEILDVAYGVMVARGDLGVEVLASEVPLMQKSIIRSCLRRAKPVIVATQMLESMISNPRATRAEVSDVANAILDGADAVMLSGETAYGDNPVDAVRTMSEISINLAKHHRKTNPAGVEPDSHSPKMFLAKSAVEAALALNASAIITPSSSGEVARVISAMRSRKPVFVPCFNEVVMRQLSLNHGIRVSSSFEYDNTDDLVCETVETLLNNNDLKEDDLVVFISGAPASVNNNSYFLEVASVRDLICSYRS